MCDINCYSTLTIFFALLGLLVFAVVTVQLIKAGIEEIWKWRNR